MSISVESQRRDRSAEIAQLVKAVAAARPKFGAISKNKQNPHLKAKYANLVSYIDATADVLAEHEIIVAQLARQNDAGAWELATNLMHGSGQWIESVLPIPMNGDPQKFGSVITYMRRYALTAMLNLSADDDDDDGHQAAQAAAPARQAPARPEPPPQTQYKILRPGKDELTRSGPDAYVTAWKKMAEAAAGNPHGFRAVADANAAVFDALCKAGEERLVQDISRIIKSALNEDAAAAA